jgi:hypothetical protein
MRFLVRLILKVLGDRGEQPERNGKAGSAQHSTLKRAAIIVSEAQ